MQVTAEINAPARAGLKIGFDAKRAFYNRSGLGNYSRNLIKALSLNYPDNSYYLFTPSSGGRIPWQPGSNCRVVEPENFTGKLFGSLWRSRLMTFDILKSNIQIYHGLSHELPSGIEKTGVKSVVTVHDIIFIKYPEFYKSFDISIYRKKLLYACRVADSIVAISNQTKKDLVEELSIDPGKISVIYQGYNSSFLKRLDNLSKNKLRSKYNLPEKFLLSVGTIEERKNLLSLVKAMHESRIEIPLVVIGKKAEAYYKKIEEFIEKNNISNILFLNTIENDDLPGFYQMAECFIYPSFYEGFGIPIIEGLVSGVPVITSKGGCFSEAGGSESIYIDPFDYKSLGESITRVLDDDNLKKRMTDAGLEYVKRFRNENISSNYMNLYRSLV